jgi:tetratricopeptide (TPR) repeat protein
MLGLLRADLVALADSPPILCFDEVDLLRPAEVEAHAQIAGLLCSLRGVCACLFIGQQPLLEADRRLLLEGLDETAVGHYLAAAGVDLPEPDRRSLLGLTDGNPRLLELFVSLHRAGEPIPDVLPRLQTAPSVEFLLARIRQHLRPAEETLLENLSVFRRPAPADAWPADSSARLVSLRLADAVVPEGIALQPALRLIIYERMRPEAKRQAHQQAAEIRIARAEYTAAAYHYLHAGQVHPALWLWHAHRSDEINQGQGAAALALFEQIDGVGLAGEDRDILALILAELGKLAGQAPRADLSGVEWQSPLLKAHGLRLQGDLAELRGQTDAAILAYQDGLATVENLLAEKSLFDKNLGWAYLRQGGASLDLAWQKACLTRFEAERLQGDIQSRRGNFDKAEACYREALASAQAYGLVEGQAKTHNHLATLLTQRGRLDAAFAHRAQALALFEQIGNQVHLAGAKLNMAFHYNLSGQQQAVLPPAAPTLFPIFEQARQVAGEALALFERVGQPLGQIIAMQNLAEANLYLGRLDEAARDAQQVIESQTQRVLPDGLRTLGEVRLAQGDPCTAEALIRESIERSQDNADPYLEAYGWRALAQVYKCGGRPAEYDDALRKALALFESLDLPQETARTQATVLRLQAV